MGLKMSRFMLPAAMVCVLGAGVVHAADEQTYTITYNRPMKVGERFEHDVKMTTLIQKMPSGGTMTLEEQAMASKPTSEKMEAKYTSQVLEVTPGGFRSKVKVTFIKLVDTTLGKPRAVAPEGTVLTLTLQPTGQVEVVAADSAFKLTPEIKGKAEKVVDLKTRADMDTLLGGVKARKVGEAWRLDKDLVLKSLGADQSVGTLDPQGTAKLKQVDDTKGATTEIVTVVKSSGSAGELAKGRLKESTISVVTEITLPVKGDTAGWVVSRDAKMKVQMEYPETATYKNLSVSINEKRDETLTALK
jgi:hypothetical protein